MGGVSSHLVGEQAVLDWQGRGAVYRSEERGGVVQPPPRGTLLMIHAGALYFCAQPLHLVLADYAPQESRAPVPSRSH